jgi:hypothetical protein
MNHKTFRELYEALRTKELIDLIEREIDYSIAQKIVAELDLYQEWEVHYTSDPMEMGRWCILRDEKLEQIWDDGWERKKQGWERKKQGKWLIGGGQFGMEYHREFSVHGEQQMYDTQTTQPDFRLEDYQVVITSDHYQSWFNGNHENVSKHAVYVYVPSGEYVDG